MDRPFAAYKGDEPYVFVSYAHKNSNIVFPELARVRDRGINVWYDEGIEAGTEWSEALAASIKRAKLFLYFVTPESAQSQNCRNEVNFAIEHQLPVIAVHLTETDLPDGLSLTLSTRQAILKHEMPVAEYEEKLHSRIAAYIDQSVSQPIIVKRNRTTSALVSFAVIMLLVLIAGYFYSQQSNESSTSVESVVERGYSEAVMTIDPGEVKGSSIAVLPFVNMSADPEQEYFSDGISEEILNVLAQVPNLHVTSRSSSFAFKGKERNLTEVARLLGVENILEGSIRKSGERIRVTAQLIIAGSDKHLWSKTFDRILTVNNVFEIQDEIASSIVDALKVKLGLSAAIESRGIAKVNLEAHNEYLKGRFFLEHRTQEDVTKALAHFTRATELSPEYAPGWVGVAWAHSYLEESQGGPLSEKEAYEGALPAIEKALVLDPNLSEAHAVLGLTVQGQNRERAINSFEKAIELNPNFKLAYIWLGNLLNHLEAERSLMLKEKAVSLDPMSMFVNASYARQLTNVSRFEETESVIAQMREIESHSPYIDRALCDLRGHQFRFGERAYYCMRMDKGEAPPLYRLGLAIDYERLGLLDLATHVMDGTPFEFFKFMLTNEIDLLPQKTKDSMPRSETDAVGAFFRARIEYFGGNFEEAAKYYRMTPCNEGQGDSICPTDAIFTYAQTGDSKQAHEHLERAKIAFQAQLDAGVPWFITETAVGLALLDNDISSAIDILNTAVSQGYIPEILIKYSPLFAPLRDHPAWLDLVTMSDKNSEKQRGIYLALVASDGVRTE